MAAPFRPAGTWTALVTPFDARGVLDVARFKQLVEFQVAADVAGVVACGTTGESPTLTWEEHEALVRSAVAKANGQVGVIAGTGSNNTAEAIRGTRSARDEGADAALVVDCYYNGPSSSELRSEYYQRVLDAVPELPLVPYIIPGRTGCALSAADLADLHLRNPDRVPAVKQATGDLARMRQDRTLAGERLAILSGDDELTLTMMRDPEVRACGVICVMSNIAPRAVIALVDAAARGDEARSNELAGKLAPLFRLVTCRALNRRCLPNGREVEVEDRYRNPLSAKTIMAGLGMIDGTCRPPLGRMSTPAVKQCRDALRQVWENAPELLQPVAEAFDVDITKRLANDSIWSALTAAG